jgi:DHA2 family multidrug resistance protein
VPHVAPTNPAAIERVTMLQRTFVGKGFDAVAAKDMAMRALDGLVSQQSTLLAFDKVFLVAGICFLAVLPLLFFLKTPDQMASGPKVDVHME